MLLLRGLGRDSGEGLDDTKKTIPSQEKTGRKKFFFGGKEWVGVD